MQKILRDLYKRFESDKPLVVVRSPPFDQKTKQHIRNFYDSGVVLSERDANLVGGLMIYRDEHRRQQKLFLDSFTHTFFLVLNPFS